MMYVCLSVFFLWSIYPSAWLTDYMSVCLSFFYYQSAPLTGWLTLCLTEDQSLNVLTKKSEPVLVSPLFRSMFVNTGWSRRRVWGVGGGIREVQMSSNVTDLRGRFFWGAVVKWVCVLDKGEETWWLWSNGVYVFMVFLRPLWRKNISHRLIGAPDQWAHTLYFRHGMNWNSK